MEINIYKETERKISILIWRIVIIFEEDGDECVNMGVSEQILIRAEKMVTSASLLVFVSKCR